MRRHLVCVSEVADISADEGGVVVCGRGGISVGIEGELEVAEVEGAADSRRNPRRTQIPILGSVRAGNPKSKCNTHLTSNTSIPAVKIESSSS